MKGQQHLDLTEVRFEPPRISPAMLLLGRTEVAKCRAALAAAVAARKATEVRSS